MNDVIVGLDTDSYGFHWVSTQPLNDPEHDSMTRQKVGWSISIGDADTRRIAAYLSARTFFQAMHGFDRIHIFCEEPLALRNGKTTRILGLAAGAIWAAFVESTRRDESRLWYWVDVAHWKKEVVGKGNASKGDVKDFVRLTPAWKDLAAQVVQPSTSMNRVESGDLKNYLDLFNDDPDLYDAWCLKVYGVRQLQGR